MQVVRFLKQIESFDPGSRHQRWNGVGEEIRARTLTQHIDDLFASRGETANGSTKRFTECSGNDFGFSQAVELFGNTPSGFSDNSSRMAFVDHHQRVVFFGQFHYFIDGSYVSVHRENAVCGDDAKTLGLCFLQFCFQIGHIGVGVAIAFCFAQAYAVDDGRVVERVGNDGVFIGKQRFEKSAVGIETSRVQNSVFRLKKLADSRFQFFVQVLRSADETHGRHSVAALIQSRFRGFNQLLVVR